MGRGGATAQEQIPTFIWQQTSALYNLIDVLLFPASSTHTPSSPSSSDNALSLCSPASAAAAARSAAAWLACFANVQQRSAERRVDSNRVPEGQGGCDDDDGGVWISHAPPAVLKALGAVLHALASACARAAAEEDKEEGSGGAEAPESLATTIRELQLWRKLRDCGLLMGPDDTTSHGEQRASSSTSPSSPTVCCTPPLLLLLPLLRRACDGGSGESASSEAAEAAATALYCVWGVLRLCGSMSRVVLSGDDAERAAVTWTACEVVRAVGGCMVDYAVGGCSSR